MSALPWNDQRTDVCTGDVSPEIITKGARAFFLTKATSTLFLFDGTTKSGAKATVN